MSEVRPLRPALDEPVVDLHGERVGSVREVLIDAAEGRIEYVCIALPGAVRLRNTEAIIPWSAIVPPLTIGDGWRVLATKAAIERIARLLPPGA